MKKELDVQIRRLRNEGETLSRAATETPQLARGRARATEKWNAVGRPGLEGLLELRREYASVLAAASALDWDRLALSAHSDAALERIRNAEFDAQNIQKNLWQQITAAEKIPSRIAGLTASMEGDNLVGCKESDFLLAEMPSIGSATELRNRIVSLLALLEKIQTTPRVSAENSTLAEAQ